MTDMRDEWVDRQLFPPGGLDTDAMRQPDLAAIVEWAGALLELAEHRPSIDNIPTTPALQGFTAVGLDAALRMLSRDIPVVSDALREAEAEGRRFHVVGEETTE